MPQSRTTQSVLAGLGIAAIAAASYSWSTPAALVDDAAAPASTPIRASDAPEADWQLFRGNPRMTGVATGTLPEQLTVLWRFAAPDYVNSAPVVGHGLVFFGCDDGKLYAIDLERGDARWVYDASLAVARSAPAASRPAADATQPNASAASQGATQRGAIAYPIEAPPSMVGDLVIVGDNAGMVHAVDVRTGREAWMFTTEAPISGAANRITLDDRSCVVVGSQDSSLYCLRADTGKLVWRYQTDDMIQGSPAVGDGAVFVAGCDGKLHVVDAATGRRRAAIPLDDQTAAAAACDAGRVYIGTAGNAVLCVDVAVGKVVWRYKAEDREFPFGSSAAVTRDTIYIGGQDKRMHALDAATGRPRWLFATKGRVDSSPVLVGSRLFFGSVDGRVYAVTVADGSLDWSFDTAQPIRGGPAVARGRLLVVTEDGVLYCFGDEARRS